MGTSYLTIRELKDKTSLSYQRLNRAINGLKKADLIRVERGENNELQVDRRHAMLVYRLLDIMQKDYGVERAITFLQMQLKAEEHVKERIADLELEVARLHAENRELRELCRQEISNT